MKQFAIHFGFARDDRPMNGDVDRSTETVLPLVWPLQGLEAFVSGSWKCWGPADQDTDGDDTIHVLVHTNQRDMTDAIQEAVIAALQKYDGCMVHPIAEPVVTTVEDHSVHVD
jgi:hypothetical protein